LIGCTSQACPTPIDQTPPAFSGPAQPVAIYATQAGGGFDLEINPGGLPDFLVWSADPTVTDVGPKPPPIYTQLRVELNQPLDGATVSQNVDLLGSNAPITYSFCSAAGNSVQ